jgi:type IV fimbrial biogenesis protein FimT
MADEKGRMLNHLINKPTKFKLKGFSLIELIIVVAIVAILAAAAVPYFGAWVQDTKTRTVAEALQNGVRLAQAEAIRRSRQVSFVLTNDTPSNLSANPNPSNTGTNWSVQTIALNAADTNDGAIFIQGAALGNASSNVVVTGRTLASSTSVISATDAANPSITFNSIGRVVSPALPPYFAVTNASGKRRLNIMVTIAGRIRMCDPDKIFDAISMPDGC